VFRANGMLVLTLAGDRIQAMTRFDNSVIAKVRPSPAASLSRQTSISRRRAAPPQRAREALKGPAPLSISEPTGR